MKRISAIRTWIGMILSMVLVVSYGCASKPENQAPKTGNSIGNIVNFGITASEGDWIYFLNMKENGTLSKMKRDGTEEAAVTTDQAAFLNIMNGSIYYCNGSDQSKVYRIRPDGSERTLVSDYSSTFLSMDGNWMYGIFSGSSEIEGKTGRIYRCKLDGSERTWVGEAYASQLNLAGDSIFYIGSKDSLLHRIKTDGTGDQVLGNIKPQSIIVSGEKIYYIDASSESNQIWSAGLDGTGAQKLSEDKASPMNISGGWIYYGHPKEEMGASEIKKMKLDGSEPTVVNEDIPMILNIHDDLLCYLDMDLATFSMIQVFVKTDGTGRIEFKQPAGNSGEDPNKQGKTYNKNEKVVGGGMTLTVDSLIATNLLLADEGSVSRFIDSQFDESMLILRCTVTNDLEEPLDLFDKLGIMANNSKDGGEYTLLVNHLADITDMEKPDKLPVVLEQSEYQESLVLKPHQTRVIQAKASLDQLQLPVRLTLSDGNMIFATVIVEPDEVYQAMKPEEAQEMITQRLFADSDAKVTAMEPFVTGSGSSAQLFYPFEISLSSGKVEYYLVDAFTRDIYSGKKDGERVVPLEIIVKASQEAPYHEEPITEGPVENPVTSRSSEWVDEKDMSVRVNFVYNTDVWRNKDGDPVTDNQKGGTYLFISLSVKNQSDKTLDLEDRFGILEVLKTSGGTTETGYNVRLADITNRSEEITNNKYLSPEEYSPSLTLKPGETLEVQAECRIEGRDFPVQFTLRPENGKESAFLDITPDFSEYFNE